MPVLRVNGHGVEITAAPLSPGSVHHSKSIQHIGGAYGAAFRLRHGANAHPGQGVKKGGDHFLRVAKDLPPQGGEGCPVSRAVFTDAIRSHTPTWR